MLSFVRTLLTAAFCSAALAGSASAAIELTKGGDQSLDCVATLSGVIETGDADRLKRFLGALFTNDNTTYGGITLDSLGYNTPSMRLCLDSPGGSISEALRMAEYLLTADSPHYWVRSLGTAIASGARCESACAIFFMAGGTDTESDIGRTPNRIMHVNARLGFHAPSIGVSDRQYSKSEVETAFKVALLSISSIAERMYPLRIRLSLLRAILSTPPDSMLYIEEIGQAAHWNIDIAGLPLLRAFTPANVMTACRTMSRQFMAEDGTRAENWGIIPEAPAANRSWIEWYSASGKWDEYAQYWTATVTQESFQSYRKTESKIDFVTDEKTDLDHIGCAGYIDAETLDASAETSSSDGWFIKVPNYWMYPPDARIADIAGAVGGAAEMPADMVLLQDTYRLDSRCYVFSGDTMSDDEPCLLEGEKTLTAAMEPRVIARFTWPSGGKTVVEYSGQDVLLNGVKARELYERPGDLDEWSHQCLLNPASGNTFCFQTK